MTLFWGEVKETRDVYSDAHFWFGEKRDLSCTNLFINLFASQIYIEELLVYYAYLGHTVFARRKVKVSPL